VLCLPGVISEAAPNVYGQLESYVKVGSHDASSRISWYKILYQGTERSTGISFSFFLDLSSDFIAM
jgi:hypothetical protein